MKTTQNAKPLQMSAAQPPKVAGHLFQVRNQREPIVETTNRSLTQAKRLSNSPVDHDRRADFDTPLVKTQRTGLW
jgi:hypothetical protein